MALPDGDKNYNQYGPQCEVCPRDHCKMVESLRGQFDAVSDQLQAFGINRSGRQLREEAVKHIVGNMRGYHNFRTENENIYVEKMKKVSEYGVHLTLIALAREYNVQFLAISSAGLPHCRIVSNDSKVDNERITLTLGHIPEHHYVSLEVESDTIDLIVYAIDEDNLVLGGQNAQPIESNGYEESVEHERSRLIEDSEDL